MENDREQNHSAEWIKREEQTYADTECQPWEDISQDELQTNLFWNLFKFYNAKITKTCKILRFKAMITKR